MEHGYDVDRLFAAMREKENNTATRLVRHVPRFSPKEQDMAVFREEPPSKP